jgi:hypothetical protein
MQCCPRYEDAAFKALAAEPGRQARRQAKERDIKMCELAVRRPVEKVPNVCVSRLGSAAAREVRHAPPWVCVASPIPRPCVAVCCAILLSSYGDRRGKHGVSLAGR